MAKILTAVLATNDEDIDSFLNEAGVVRIIKQVFYKEICLDIVLERQPDILILSEFLPGQKYSIVELVELIRKKTSSTRIIFLMGYLNDGNERLQTKLISMGVYDFLSGEFTGTELLDIIRNPRTYRDVAHLHKPEAANVKTTKTEHPISSQQKTKVIKTQIVAFWSPKGGVGTTTLAVDVAAILSSINGVSTVLVDLDLSTPDIHLFVSAKPKEGGFLNLIPLIDGERLSSEHLKEQIVRGGRRARQLMILPGVIGRPELAENLTVDHVETCLRELQRAFDLVLLNISSNMSEIGTYVGLNSANRVIVVTSQDAAAVAETYRYLCLLKRLKIPVGKCDLIVNKYDAGAGVGVDLITKVTELKPEYVFPSLPRSLIVSSKFNGCPLVFAKGGGQVLEDYKNKVKSLANNICPLVKMPGPVNEGVQLFSWIRSLKMWRKEHVN